MFSLGSPQGDSCQNGKIPVAGAAEVNYMSRARPFCLSYQRIPSWDAATKLACRSKGQACLC